jgi:hypothetical protein
MLPSTICIFRHALALDERRVKFLPEHFVGARSAAPHEYTPHTWPRVCVTDLGSNVAGDGEGDGLAFREWECSQRRSTSPPEIKEVWFPGSHADMFVILISFSSFIPVNDCIKQRGR